MPIMNNRPKPFVLIILDGWGYRETNQYNAIAQANTPTWDKLWRDHSHMLLSGSGEGVGLPEGQMGNSEVGHLNMGSGRIIYQEFTRIETAIADQSFFKNPVMLQALQKVNKNNKAVHILGLLSPGGVHSHERQIYAMIELAIKAGCQKIYVHPFLDGRDTPPQSAKGYLESLEKNLQRLGRGSIASLIGRFYAMDRDKRWDRIQKAYELLTEGKAERQAENAIAGLLMAYELGETDEFVKATAVHPANQPPITVQDGDAIIFMNYRADRARQLTHAFLDLDFKGFPRHRQPKLADFVSLTEYAIDIPAAVAFKPEQPKNVLGEYAASLGLRQLRIAETEKYAHVTFFFNGGIEAPFPGEDRVLIPSPKISTYDLQPEMSAIELTDKLVIAIDSGQYDLIICNYANPDMVGHTGIFPATVKAIEVIDHCLNRITHALEKVGGEAIITADHGNAECMYDDTTKQAHTAHTSDPVPFIYFGRKAQILINDGKLSDIAPTILNLLSIPIPEEMTGRVLMTPTPE